jgi:tetratricopeptide (TPR) repeat protein
MDFTLIDKYANLEIAVGESEIEDLEALVATHPWFTLARVLLLKGYRNENRPDYQTSCMLTSLYTPNRRRLYRFVEKGTTKISQSGSDISGDETNWNSPNKRDRLSSFSNEYFSPDEFLNEFSNDSTSLEDDLIAKFINESPKIIPNKETVSQDPDLDNPVDSSSMVSETLAEIYLMQGLYEQSIECYNKLILLYPEKSVYFAGKINEIKNIKK